MKTKSWLDFCSNKKKKSSDHHMLTVSIKYRSNMDYLCNYFSRKLLLMHFVLVSRTAVNSQGLHRNGSVFFLFIYLIIFTSREYKARGWRGDERL